MARRSHPRPRMRSMGALALVLLAGSLAAGGERQKPSDLQLLNLKLGATRKLCAEAKGDVAGILPLLKALHEDALNLYEGQPEKGNEQAFLAFIEVSDFCESLMPLEDKLDLWEKRFDCFALQISAYGDAATPQRISDVFERELNSVLRAYLAQPGFEAGRVRGWLSSMVGCDIALEKETWDLMRGDLERILGYPLKEEADASRARRIMEFLVKSVKGDLLPDLVAFFERRILESGVPRTPADIPWNLVVSSNEILDVYRMMLEGAGGDPIEARLRGLLKNERIWKDWWIPEGVLQGAVCHRIKRNGSEETGSAVALLLPRETYRFKERETDGYSIYLNVGQGLPPRFDGSESLSKKDAARLINCDILLAPPRFTCLERNPSRMYAQRHGMLSRDFFNLIKDYLLEHQTDEVDESFVTSAIAIVDEYIRDGVLPPSEALSAVKNTAKEGSLHDTIKGLVAALEELDVPEGPLLIDSSSSKRNLLSSLDNVVTKIEKFFFEKHEGVLMFPRNILDADFLPESFALSLCNSVPDYGGKRIVIRPCYFPSRDGE